MTTHPLSPIITGAYRFRPLNHPLLKNGGSDMKPEPPLTRLP